MATSRVFLASSLILALSGTPSASFERLGEQPSTGVCRGWWLSQPENVYAVGDAGGQPVVTDDRSGEVHVGRARVTIIGSLGDKRYDVEPGGRATIRFSPFPGDLPEAKALLSEIGSAFLRLDARDGFRTIFARIRDNLGGECVSEQTFRGVSTIILPNHVNTVYVSASTADHGHGGESGGTPIEGDPAVTIVGGEQPQGFDIDRFGKPLYVSGHENYLDFGGYEAIAPVPVTLPDGSTARMAGVALEGGRLLGAKITFEDFQRLDGTDHGDYVAGATSFKEIVLGKGDNYVRDLSGGAPPEEERLGDRAHRVKLWLGSGNSIVAGTTAPGSLIKLSGRAAPHHTLIEISPGVRIEGLERTDRLTWFDIELTGGYRLLGASDPWFYGLLARYRVDEKGQLIVSPYLGEARNAVRSWLSGDSVDETTVLDHFYNETSQWPSIGGIVLSGELGRK